MHEITCAAVHQPCPLAVEGARGAWRVQEGGSSAQAAVAVVCRSFYACPAGRPSRRGSPRRPCAPLFQAGARLGRARASSKPASLMEQARGRLHDGPHPARAGVYADLDFEALRNLEPLLEERPCTTTSPTASTPAAAPRRTSSQPQSVASPCTAYCSAPSRALLQPLWSPLRRRLQPPTTST